MSQTTLILSGAALAAITIAAGLFGYKSMSESGERIDPKLPAEPSYSTSYQNTIQTSCSKSFKKALGDRKAVRLYVDDRVEAICSCLARELVDGRNKKEAKLIAKIVPMQLQYELIKQFPDLPEKKKARLSKGQAERLRKKTRRKQKEMRSEIMGEMRKAIRTSGLNKKRAKRLLKETMVQRMQCARAGA